MLVLMRFAILLLIFCCASQARVVRVLSYNTFLLPINGSANATIPARLPLMASEIARAKADVILLQEVWGDRFRSRLAADLAQYGYKHVAYAPPTSRWSVPGAGLVAGGTVVTGVVAGSPAIAKKFCGWHLGRRAFLASSVVALLPGGVTGTLIYGNEMVRDYGHGLLTLSKYPIRDVQSTYFSDYTRPEEAFIFKGGMKAQVQLPGLGWVDVYNTHLGAQHFNEDGEAAGSFLASDEAGNLDQLKALFSWMAGTRTHPTDENGHSGDLILAGDFNINREVITDGAWSGRLHDGYMALSGGQFGYDLGLFDSFVSVHGFDSRGYTDGRVNLLALEQLDNPSAHPPGLVLDYQLHRVAGNLRPVGATVMFGEDLRQSPRANLLRQQFGLAVLPAHISDHNAVAVVYEYGPQ